MKSYQKLAKTALNAFIKELAVEGALGSAVPELAFHGERGATQLHVQVPTQRALQESARMLARAVACQTSTPTFYHLRVPAGMGASQGAARADSQQGSIRYIEADDISRGRKIRRLDVLFA